MPWGGAVNEESFVNLGKTLHHGEITLDRGRISAPKEGDPHAGSLEAGEG